MFDFTTSYDLTMKVGDKILVKDTDGEWTEATIIQRASSINRRIPWTGGRYQGHRVILANGQSLVLGRNDTVKRPRHQEKQS